MLRNIVILFFISLVINPESVMSESLSDDNKSIIVRTVISKILLSLPSSIEKICIMEIDFSNDKSRERKVLVLKDLDNRIVTDDSACTHYSVDHKSSEVITFMTNIGPTIEKMARSSDRQGEEVYDRIIKHLKAGNTLVGASSDKCGADIYTYAFKIAKNGPKLLESAVLGSVECTIKQKD